MPILMDDPTTYLERNTDDLAIMLATSVTVAQDVCRMYGVSIQVNMVDPTKGIRVVTSLAEANAAVAAYAPTTPWCIISPANPNLYLPQNALAIRFGTPLTVAKCLGVETDGIAWRPDRYPVIPL